MVFFLKCVNTFKKKNHSININQALGTSLWRVGDFDSDGRGEALVYS